MLTMLLAVSLGALPDDRTRDDTELTIFVEESLQGTWKVEKAEGNRKVDNELLGATFTFTRDRLTLVMGKNEKEVLGYTLKDAVPKQINLINLDAVETETAQGIYQLTGERLKLCFAQPELKKRPTEFKSAALTTYIELKRVKP
jgi:uncharacterized protein (TIGR03067 family)